MEKSRFSETRIASILKETDVDRPVKDVYRKRSISQATCLKWKSKYGGIEASDLKRAKELDAENARLKRMYADIALEHTAMRDLIYRTL